MPDVTVPPAIAGLRWARRAVLLGAVLISAVLIATAWLNYTAARGAARELERGEALAISESLLGYLRGQRQPPSSALLDDWLTANRDRGVRYAAVSGPGGTVTAGSSLGPNLVGPVPGPHAIRRLGDRIRITGRAAPPRGPPRPPGPPPPGARRPRRGPPGHVVEFVPVQVNQLIDRARRSLAINIAIGLLLLGAGIGAWRWLRGREARELVRAREKQLARLGEMSAVLAHEIKNPLASLKGHAQLLAESPADDRTRSKADRIVREAVRLETLTRELLELVRTGQIDRRDCSPAELLETAAGDVEPDRGEPGRIAIDRADAPARFALDPERMRQVLTNLLRNALEASPDPTPVDARAASERGDLVFQIRDRGPGIPAGEEDRIFEPFHTTRTRGTGLGLAVSRRIVELHGGRISAGNHPDGGAVFTVVIPPVEEQ